MWTRVRSCVSQLLVGIVAACQGAENDLRETFEQDPGPRLENKNEFALEFDLINNSSDQYGRGDPNPAATVRAVNHLHSLGKERALLVLREYQRYAAPFGDGSGAELPSQHHLSVIIPLLFVPIAEGAEVPSLGRSPFDEGMKKKWDPFLVIVNKDLPFHRAYVDIRGSLLPDRGYLVEWAEKHGRLREKQLRPHDDCLKAADDICDLLAMEGVAFDRFRKSFIRAQAVRCIQQLIQDDTVTDAFDMGLDEEWRRIKEIVSKVAIRWSVKEQRYVVE